MDYNRDSLFTLEKPVLIFVHVNHHFHKMQAHLLGLGEGTSVAGGARIPQPYRPVPAARYHDIDFRTVLNTTDRCIMCSHNCICWEQGKDCMSPLYYRSKDNQPGATYATARYYGD